MMNTNYINDTNDMNNTNDGIENLLDVLKCLKEIIDVMDGKKEVLEKLKLECFNSNLNDSIKSDVSSLYFLIYDRLTVYKNIKQSFEIKLCLNCNHEFETDYVDDSSCECRKIVYCKKCEINKEIIDDILTIQNKS